MWSMVVFLLCSWGLYSLSIWSFLGFMGAGLIVLFTQLGKYWFYVGWTDSLLVVKTTNSLFLFLTMAILIIMIYCGQTSTFEFWFMILAVFKIMYFSVCHLFLFYIFFELSILPMLIIILGWGSNPERLNAGSYMIIYTLAGSLPLLVGLLFFMFLDTSKWQWAYEGSATMMGSYVMPIYLTFIGGGSMLASWGYTQAKWFFLLLTMSFLMKLPVYGVHLWLPKAHVEAPTGGSMVLASVLLKLGVYGLLRVNQSTGRLVDEWGLFCAGWAVMGLLVAGVICFRQTDLKMLMAYSSVFHMLIILLTLSSGNSLSAMSVLLLSMGHGFTSAVLFFNVGVFYSASGTRSMVMKVGWMWKFPLFMFIWFGTLVLKSKFPPTMKFFAEVLMVLSGSMWVSSLVFVVVWSVFLGGLYKIYLFMVNSHGKVSWSMNLSSQMNHKEIFLSSLLISQKILCVFWWWFLYNNGVQHK